MDFGAFVKLEPGVEGLIHVSELAHGRVFRASDVVSEGQEVEVKVLSVDAEKQRIGLSLKALHGPARKAGREEGRRRRHAAAGRRAQAAAEEEQSSSKAASAALAAARSSGSIGNRLPRRHDARRMHWYSNFFVRCARLSLSIDFNMLTVILPDGSRKQFDRPVTAYDVAAEIGPGLAKAAVLAEVDGRQVDLAVPLPRAAKSSCGCSPRKTPKRSPSCGTARPTSWPRP